MTDESAGSAGSAQAPEKQHSNTPTALDRAHAIRLTWRNPRLWIVVGLAVGLAAAAQFAGPAVIPLGAASMTVLPMVWGLIAGGAVSGQRWRPLGLDLQSVADTFMSVAVLILCARSAFTVGPNVALLFEAGPALLLQEVGHLFGTIALALPLAVMLRMGPATVGATFSIDREASFAMVSARFGVNSPQYRGVLSMYVFGTIFGAILISFIASIAASLGVFDPLALAMGAGVGSGSMMAAAAGAVAAAHPEMTDTVLAVAATSNFVTIVIGMYVGVWVALPLADRFYRFLTRKQTLPVAESRTVNTVTAPTVTTVAIPLTTTIPILSVMGIIVSSVAAKQFSWTIVLGYLVLAALVLVCLGISRLTRGKIPSLISIITLGALITTPVSPVADALGVVVGTIDFLSVCTMVLTIAGLSLGKSLPMLRNIGWKIIPVGIVAILASYLLSVLLAEFVLGFWS